MRYLNGFNHICISIYIYIFGKANVCSQLHTKHFDQLCTPTTVLVFLVLKTFGDQIYSQ